MSVNPKPSATIPTAPPAGMGKKGSKRKKNTAKIKASDRAMVENGAEEPDEPGPDDVLDGPAEATKAFSALELKHEPQPDEVGVLNHAPEDGDGPLKATATPRERSGAQPIVIPNGSAPRRTSLSHETSRMESRWEEMSKERQSLRDEVKGLREALEDIQEKHEKDISAFRAQLDEARGSKEHAEQQYRNLLGKLNTIKSQLGERLKADAEDLSQARAQIDQLEETNRTLEDSRDQLRRQVDRLQQEGEQRSKELSTLRNRTTLSQQNWLKEREDLQDRETAIREEFEAARQAMQDWEVLAMDERSIREGLAERASVLEDQLSSQKEEHASAAAQRDELSLAVNGLQRALQDLQDARKRELRDMVDSNEEQTKSLRKQLEGKEATVRDTQASLERLAEQLQRALPFEQEVKEKNLLIGKLRHEAVILNDHLTKALRFLRKGRPEDNVDRQIVTNHFLQFLALDRADPKKFQILQLIAALLQWTEGPEQREQAGLTRPGTSSNNNYLRAPLSPFHRTPSTPSTTAEFFSSERTARKESLAELWSNFLEQEAQTEPRASSTPLETSSATHPPG